MKVLDSTYLIDLLHGEKETLSILSSKELLFTTQINMYEIIRGLFLRKVASHKFIDASDLFEHIKVLPLNDSSIIRSADIFSILSKKGTIISDADCLTAGIALSYGITTLVTRNKKHFERIPGLHVESY